MRAGAWCAQVWSRATAEDVATLRGHGGFVYCLALDLGRGRLVSGGIDKTFRVWSTGSWECVRTVQWTSWVCTLALQGDALAVGGMGEDEAAVVDVRSGERVCGLPGYDNGGEYYPGLAIRGGVIVGPGAGGTLKVWRAAS